MGRGLSSAGPGLLLASLAACASSPSTQSFRAATAGLAPLAPPRSPVAIVHLFEWRWLDVAEECERFLGPAGYSAVQLSPPNEHVTLPGRPWYERYQPISYRLDSRSGTREELAQMVRRCAAVGVDILADAVLNHMSGRPAGTGRGIAGTPYAYEDYPGLYAAEDFHHCGRNGDGSIQSYQDRWEVQHCTVYTLSDLATEKPRVQARLASYLQDLLDLGVRGFRIDAAKHIPAEELAAVFARLRAERPPFIFQEVVDPGTEPIRAAEYLRNGHVTEFAYPHVVGKALRSGALEPLRTLGEGLLPTERAVVFIDNHDLQRASGPSAGEVLTHRDGRRYALANALMLALPYGTPAVMSSYRFTDYAQPPPSTTEGVTAPALTASGLCADGWLCEHRWPQLAGMVQLRAKAAGAPVTRWWAKGAALAFAREGRAFFAMNAGAASVSLSLATGLPAGSYCNVAASTPERALVPLEAPLPPSGCRVEDAVALDASGTVRHELGPTQVLAIHLGSATLPAAAARR